MNRLIIICLALFCIFFVSGCQTVKNTFTGFARATYMAADKWFKEHYW